MRPIMHRASLVEIIVPYGDPRHPFEKKCAYDIVDYGLGFTANSLELGCDCLGHIQYFDAVLNNSKGERSLARLHACLTACHIETAAYWFSFLSNLPTSAIAGLQSFAGQARMEDVPASHAYRRACSSLLRALQASPGSSRRRCACTKRTTASCGSTWSTAQATTTAGAAAGSCCPS